MFLWINKSKYKHIIYQFSNDWYKEKHLFSLGAKKFLMIFTVRGFHVKFFKSLWEFDISLKGSLKMSMLSLNPLHHIWETDRSKYGSRKIMNFRENKDPAEFTFEIIKIWNGDSKICLILLPSQIILKYSHGQSIYFLLL